MTNADFPLTSTDFLRTFADFLQTSTDFLRTSTGSLLACHSFLLGSTDSLLALLAPIGSSLKLSPTERPEQVLEMLAHLKIGYFLVV